MPKYKTKVKKASEIIKWFEDRGVLNPDCFNDWVYDDAEFDGNMFKYCGKEPLSEYIWHIDWLEEVDE